MADDPLNDIIASVRARLEQELGAQLRTLAERHQQALADARREIEAAVEQRWGAQLEAARADAQQRAETAVASVRAELEREHAIAIARVRDEAAAATEQVRRHAAAELDQAVAAARTAAQAQLDADRRDAAEQLERLRDELDAERALAPHHAALPAAPLLEGLRQVDAATSLSETITALVRAAAARAERAALFVANGTQLDEWAVSGIPSLGPGHAEGPTAALLEQALLSREFVRGSDGAFAAPLVLDRVAVGVLYGKPGADADGEWSSGLEVLARHGSAHLAALTATRTAQARQWLASTPSGAAAAPVPSSEDVAAAKRYARLLVSEIKLYNEPAVRLGRQERNLLQRLGPEIERARRLYEERVPAHVAGRAQHFHSELVQTLAGGDPSLLH